MMKLLLLLAVVVVALYMFKSRQRRSDAPPAVKPHKPPPPPAEPVEMLACAHCGVHLPQAEVLAGADGRPYCTEAHRLAGPR